MKQIPIIDGHIDLAWNYIAIGRRFEDSIDIKHSNDRKEIVKTEGLASVGFPEVQKGNIRIIFATIWVETDKSLYPTIGPKYTTISEAVNFAKKQYQYYMSLCNKNGFTFITSREEFESVICSQTYKFGIVPIIEGADFIYDKSDLNYWIENGIKIIAPIWQKNQIGGCAELGGDLTTFGKNLIKYMSKKKMIIDISHMSDEATRSTFDCFEGTIINSHTCCRHFIDSERLISDWQIQQIHKRNGVIGLMTWSQKLKEKSVVDINDFVDHIYYIADLTGSVDNIAIGSSMDGGYGAESLPKGMESIESLNLLQEVMMKRRFSERDIEAVFFKNWLRIFCTSEKT